MDLRTKIVRALRETLAPELMSIKDDDGIIGYVVSPRFERMQAFDRQVLIDGIVEKVAPTPQARHRVLMIAGLTPNEYEAVGVKIRVHRVKAVGGEIEIILHGSLADAEFVQGVLRKHDDVQTSEPMPVPDAEGILVSFRARSSSRSPLTRSRTLELLKANKYIEVMPKA